jgi:predicted DNA-binding antitoxin AbrB/MazE fold protein
MPKTLQAVYEKGVLRLTEPIALEEGAFVEIVIFKRNMVPKTPKNILAKIAALPILGNTQPFSGEDHDSILYSINDNL